MGVCRDSRGRVIVNDRMVWEGNNRFMCVGLRERDSESESVWLAVPWEISLCRVSFECQVTLVIEGRCGGGGATHSGRPRNQRTESVPVT